jgi:glycosyltransferase involved in cell wall biosynthesis
VEDVTRSQARSRICYVVPSYSRSDATHFAHLPRFLELLGKHCTLDVIVERSIGTVSIANASIHVQRLTRFRLLRMFELAVLAWRLQRSGCRRFFVRISVTAALTLGVLRHLLPIEVFYWNSGQGRNTLPSWRTPMKRARAEIASLPFRAALRLVDRLVTGPESMGDYYRDAYGIPADRIVITYNDVASAPFRAAKANDAGRVVKQRLGIAPDIPILLFVGRVSELKGGHNLLALCQILKGRGVRVLCVAVGSVHLVEVARAAGAQGVDNVLRLVGPVANSELPSFYAAADIFVLPSESEGFPRVLLEAMAAELPVVAYDVGGVRDILGDRQQRYVCPRGDIACLADAIATLLSDADQRTELSLENRARVARYETPAAVSMFLERVVNSEVSSS